MNLEQATRVGDAKQIIEREGNTAYDFYQMLNIIGEKMLNDFGNAEVYSRLTLLVYRTAKEKGITKHDISRQKYAK